MYTRGWIVGQIWTGDPPSADSIREETATAIHRLAHILRRGTAATLGEMIDQEGTAMADARCGGPRVYARCGRSVAGRNRPGDHDSLPVWG